MHENAICQYRRDSTYTVPYVPADWICAARDHEPRLLAERRSAAGTARRRFDLKVELQAIRLPFDIPAPSTFVKRRRAIPTFGSRQAPRHEPGFARHEYPRIESHGPSLYSQPVALAIKYRDSHGRAALMMPP